MSTQGDLAVEGCHRDCSRMARNSADGGPDPLVQHRIVNPIILKSRPQLGRCTDGAVPGIAGCSREAVT
jgi:hypothetical protein